MRNHRLLSLLLAAILLTMPICTALADEGLYEATDAVLDLLFYTENVTVTGWATFDLDGQRFKTVDVTYIQDGEKSYWDLKTVTPKADGTEREGGYTIIADGENIYVMEVYYPGLYKMANDEAQTTLMRETSLLGPMAAFLGYFTLDFNGIPTTVTETVEGEEIQLSIGGEEIPGIVDTGLNVIAQYLAGRYFHVEPDHGTEYLKFVPWERYLTTTQALVNTTDWYMLKSADVDFCLNKNRELTSVTGTMTVDALDFHDETRTLKIDFDLRMEAYGESAVKPFDPAEYNVVPPQEYWDWYNDGEGEEYDPETDPIDESFNNRAIQAVKDLGYTVGTEIETTAFRNDGYVKVNVWGDMNGDVMVCMYEDQDVGQAYNLDNTVLLWDAEVEPVSGVDQETLDRAAAYLKEAAGKLCSVSGELAETLSPVGMVRDSEGDLFLYFEDDLHCLFFILRMDPEWIIEGYRLDSLG